MITFAACTTAQMSKQNSQLQIVIGLSLLFLSTASAAAADEVAGGVAARKPNGDQVTGDQGSAGNSGDVGKAIYADRCASCHGGKGQGNEEIYPAPLTGDLSIGELAEVITETMPEGEPESCTGADAKAVARYMHHAFYSEAARLRNRPARVSLARLTAVQLQQSLADLYSQYAGLPEVSDPAGLSGEYYDGRRAKKDNLRIERIDPVINFDFGRESPGGGIDPEEFSIRWNGGLRADVTGRYELVVRSTCSFVFDFGADDRVLINNHVQSGDKTEFRRTLTLLAGRVYPISIRFTQRERKTEQPPAKISLSWIPPGGVEQILPARHLVSQESPATFALQTDLPPDDRSYGYERGISVNRQWDESTTAAAIEFAGVAADELWPRFQRRHRKDDDQDRERLRSFLATLVETAFRTPELPAELRQRYIDQQVDQEPDDAEAIKRVLLMTLKSPRFLYPTLDLDAPPSRRVANRLALTLHDSLPSDNWLIERAGKGQLLSEREIRDAARRMVDDYRTRGKVRAMFYQWLDISEEEDLTKDAELYPGFDEGVVHDLRRSLDAMIDEVVWGDSSDYRDLFLESRTFTTDRLEEFYGESWKAANENERGLRKSVGDPNHRFGILTHPLLMSGLAYHDHTSPIHRGVFLIRHLLGRTLRPPNEAFSPLSPDLHPDLTTRERVALQTSPESCQVCHSKINALGFTLENYDAVGRIREQELGRAIDSTGSYTSLDNDQVRFAGPQDLAEYLATSEDATRAFTSQAFEFFVKQPIAAYGPKQLDRLADRFRERGYNIRDLLVEIAVIAARPAVGDDAQVTTPDRVAKSP